MKSRTAEQKIDSLMAFYNDNPQSLVFSRLADIYRKEGNFSKAIEICTNGLQYHPEYVTGRVVLGQCYYEQGNVQAALQEFLTVCSYDRKNQIAIKMLADLYSRQKMMDKAGDLYNLLHRMDPGNNSIRQLTKQFLPSGQTDIFTILGLPLPKSDINFASQNQHQDNVFSDNNQFQEIDSMQDPSSAIDEISPEQISPDDLDDRMNSLFGSDQQEQLDPQTVQEDGFNSITENDLDSNITGDDVTNRMDAMFGGDTADKETDPSSIITEITEDDLSNQIGMQEGNGVEEINIASEQYDNSMQYQPMQENSFESDSNEPIITGDELSNHLNNILNDDNNAPNESVFSNSDIIELTGNDEQNVTGDDVALQIDSMIPNDSSSNVQSLDPNIQEFEIQNDTTDNVEELLTPNDTITGVDLVNHLDNITGNNSTDNTFQIQSVNDISNQDNEQLISTDDSDQSDARQAFDTEIQMDAILNMDDSISQSDINMDGQIFDLTSDMNSEQQVESNDIVSGDDISLHLDNLMNQNTDNNLIQNEENQSIESITDSVYDNDSNDSDGNDDSGQINNFEITQQIDLQSLNGQITGDDVSEHIDKILGNSDQSDSSPIYDKINFDQNDTDSESDDELIDDRTDQIDMSTINSSLSEEPDFSPSNDADADNHSQNDLISEELTVPGDETENTVNNASSINNNFNPFSSSNDSEFEETFQFDRSAIDNAMNGAGNDQINQDSSNQIIDLNENNLNPFDFENETLSIDRAELNSLINNTDQLINNSNNQSENLTQSGNVSQNDEELIQNVDNQTSSFESPESDDVNLEEDNRVISDMDVLIAPASDTQVVTGDDVVDKLNFIFPSKENSNQNQQSSSNNTENQELSLENPFDNDQNATSDNSSITVDDEKPEELSEISFTEENLLEINDESDNSNVIFSEDEPAEQLQISKDIDNSQDTETNDSSFALSDSSKESDTDSESTAQTENHIEQQDSSETPNEELDDQDKPYSIPDHVLTPTLADIYYQQGQLQLAVQIYSRLVEKDPDNDRLRERLEEIQKSLLAQKEEPQGDTQKPIQENTVKVPKSAANGKQKKKLSEIDRPLAGVRLKKSVKKRKAGSK